MLVDPVQLDLELLGREADGAEDAEAAGLADGGDDVAAVGEGEDRELDAELVADVGVRMGQSALGDRRVVGVKRTGIVLDAVDEVGAQAVDGLAGSSTVGQALDELCASWP